MKEKLLELEREICIVFAISFLSEVLNFFMANISFYYHQFYMQSDLWR